MNTRDAILHLIRDQLDLDDRSTAALRESGRLDRFTAVDSLFMVELVLSLEERFGIRFDPEAIDAALVSDLDRLAAFIDTATA